MELRSGLLTSLAHMRFVSGTDQRGDRATFLGVGNIGGKNGADTLDILLIYSNLNCMHLQQERQRDRQRGNERERVCLTSPSGDRVRQAPWLS